MAISTLGPAAVVAERIFSASDVALFAELSGDYNPLHVDAMAARRTHFGQCVVHGVLLLLWALETLEEHAAVHRLWARVSVRFVRPVVVGTSVQLTSIARDDGQIALTLRSGGRSALECEFTLRADSGPRHEGFQDALPQKETAAAGTLDQLSQDPQLVGLYWSSRHGSCLFPSLARFQSGSSLAAFVAATRIVGMKMPGEHSIFMGLDLNFAATSSGENAAIYRLLEYRKSTSRIAIGFTSPAARGTLWALARPAPVPQPAMADVKCCVTDGRFAGRNILVLGGSRGLGELTAKIVAAGGAKVTLTYRVGGADASRVVDDIRSHDGCAEAFPVDINCDDLERTLSEHGAGLDHLCYFATPTIIDGDGEAISWPLFSKYADVYVRGLMRVAQWMARETSGKFAVFNASSAAVDTPSIRNLEYAAAKASSELCCRWLEVAYPQSRIHVARFPRLPTDQTASFLSSGEHDSLQTVLGELSNWLA